MITLNSETNESNSVGMIGFHSVPVYDSLKYNIRKDGLATVEGELWLTGDTMIQIDMSSVGIEDRSLPGIQIYPNPLKDELTITGLEGETMVFLMDMTGRVLITATYTSTRGRLQVSELPSGTYLLRMITVQNEPRVFMIIKE